MSAYQKLQSLFEKYYYLKRTRSLLDWDSAVMMPAGSALVRSKQLATLQGVMQDLIGDRRVARWLAESAGDTSLNSWQRANLQEMTRLYQLNIAVPDALKQKLIAQSVLSEQAWRQARAENNYPLFAEAFTRLLVLVREKARHLSDAFELKPYEALMQEYDWGTTQKDTDSFLGKLKSRLPGLLAGVREQQGSPSLPVKAPSLSISRQQKLCKRVLSDMGFDFNNGRLDRSAHPFTEGGYQDIRITTCFDVGDVTRALMGSVHEFGHAQYDSNLPGDWHTQPVGHDRGMGIHEGMALFYEMAIARSPAFIHYLAGIYKEHGWPFEEASLRQSLLQCQPGCIRVDADEISYILHIILRYDIEKALLDGSLDIAGIPEYWNAGMLDLFDVQVPDLAQGCLQDIHWSLGLIGYFPSYAYGAVGGANLYCGLLDAGIAIPGRYDPAFFNRIQAWLTENISCKGSSISLPQMTRQLDLGNVDRYIDYLTAKYPCH